MFTTIRAGMALWARRTIRMAASAAPSRVGSRTRKHQPRATASFGVPAPINRRISSPRLWSGDMDQVALVDILPAPQPRPAHTTAVQDVSEGALDQFRSLAHRLLADF